MHLFRNRSHNRERKNLESKKSRKKNLERKNLEWKNLENMIFLSSCSMLIQGYIFSSVPSVYDARAGLYDSCFICLFHTRVWVWMVEEVTLTLTHTLRYFEYSEFYFSEFKNFEVINFLDFAFRDFEFSRF